MASTHVSAPAPATARRAPASRGSAPPGPVPRKAWTTSEKGQLKGYFEQAANTPVWKELAERLGTGRTGKQVQAMAAKLKLTEPIGRTARGPAWDAEKRRHGTKDNKRQAALTLASPAGVPPSEPRPKRPAAVAADAALRAELEAGLKLDRELFTAAGSGIITEANTHKAWAYYYVSVLGCTPEEEWDTRITGTVSLICAHYSVPKGSRASVRAVLEDVTACIEMQIEYGGERSRVFRAQANLDLDGFEAQIIADCMEDDFSLRQTLAEVNLYREFHDASGAKLTESCPRDVGFNSVYTC